MSSSGWFLPSPAPQTSEAVGMVTSETEPDLSDLLLGVFGGPRRWRRRRILGGGGRRHYVACQASTFTQNAATDLEVRQRADVTVSTMQPKMKSAACQVKPATRSVATGSNSQPVADAATSTCCPELRPVGTQTSLYTTDGFATNPHSGVVVCSSGGRSSSLATLVCSPNIYII